MQPSEAFRIGFLARCVEVGLTPAATHNLVKSAEDYFTKASAGLFETLQGITVPTLMMAAAAPIAMGGGAAYLANKATDTDATDIAEIKQKELMAVYRRMTQQLQTTAKLRGYKADRKRTGRVFL
jgi:hypothetical protein